MTRVLIVEDSPTQAEALRMLLEVEGFAVEWASDAEEALERLPGAAFDLVISDVLMPGLSGYELCRRIKGRRRGNELPVVLLTSLSEPENIIEGLQSGADSFITKPYDPEQLTSRVRSILDNRRFRAQGRLKLGAEVLFFGRKITVTSDRQQILDLLVTTLEDVVSTNRELQDSQAALAAANAKLEEYAQKLETKVRLSEEKYRSLMEHAHDAVLVADPTGAVLEVNREGEIVFGRSASEIVGRSYRDLVPAEERSYVEAHFEKVLVEKAARTNDLTIARPDGSSISVDVSASLVESGAQHFILLLVRDVTERNRMQQRAMEQDKLAVVGTLAATVAHEVNSPATVVLGNLTVLEEEVEVALRSWELSQRLIARLPREEAEQLGTTLSSVERCASRYREMIGDSLHAARRITEIVGDLTSFTRAEDEDMVRIDVNERLDIALRIAVPRLGRRVHLERHYAHDLPAVAGNARRLEQLFLNLIVNAAHAIEEKGGGEGRLTVSTRSENGVVRIDVADTGKGIEPDVLPRIFDAFFTTKAAGVGTGLGLSICRDIVQHHAGTLDVDSEVGRGTVVSVRLPAGTAAVDAVGPRGAGERLARCRLLLVDDDVTLLRTYQRMLESRHGLSVAAGGRPALSILSEDAHFDAVLCDLTMPDVDGIDLYRYVHERNPALARRMIFLTGGAFTERAEEFLAEVPNPRLTKPAALGDIERAIGEVVSRR